MAQQTDFAGNKAGGARGVAGIAARAVWRGWSPFRVARLLGPQCTLRCVLFHEVADRESSFTSGLGVTVARQTFENALKFITRYYTPVSLSEVLEESGKLRLAPPPVLLTFDDAYASIAEFAAPLCFEYGVPAVFFVNGSCLDNRQLALDNLISHVASERGLEAIGTAVLEAGSDASGLGSLAQVFSQILPSMSLTARTVFRDALIVAAQCHEADLAADSRLYLSSGQLRDLAALNIEVGNHTYSHVNCRSLLADEFAGEIDRNKTLLESITETRVRSFSVPYGSSLDMTPALTAHLRESGYEALFLAEGKSNFANSLASNINRVSIKANTEASLFGEIEILPRLRTIRNRVSGRANAQRRQLAASVPHQGPRSPHRSSASTAEIHQEHSQTMMHDAPFQIEVDAFTPAQWSEMLDRFADASIYQSWSYGAARWGAKNLSHLAITQGGEVKAMAQVRILRPTPFKLGIAYLRWGPLFHRKGQEPDGDVFLRMARALHDEYVGRRGLVLEVVPNAFVDSPRAALFQSAFSRFDSEQGTSASPYRTLVLDLAPTVEQLRAGLDKKWRNQLVRSEKNGLKVIADTSVESYGRFCQMYREMQKRKAFASTVDVEEFARIQQSLPENLRMQTLLCEQNGVVVAGLIASAIGDSAIYLLGATSDQGLTAKGGYLLQWTLIESLKKSGVRWYDLGGIDPDGNPGVYHFKKGLSGVEASHIRPLVAHNDAVSYALFRAIMASRSAVRDSGALHAAKTLLSGLIRPVRFVEARLFGRVS